MLRKFYTLIKKLLNKYAVKISPIIPIKKEFMQLSKLEKKSFLIQRSNKFCKRMLPDQFKVTEKLFNIDCFKIPYCRCFLGFIHVFNGCETTYAFFFSLDKTFINFIVNRIYQNMLKYLMR